MKILFFIESLESGGKERRLVELLKKINKRSGFEIELVITRKDIVFKEIHNLNIKIHIIERKSFKKDPRLFYKFFKITKTFRPDIIHAWGNMVAFYAIPAKIFLKVPMINNQITDAPERVYNGILSHKITFAFSDLIVSNSRAGHKAYNSPLKKRMVIYNGFDFNRISKLSSESEIRNRFSIHTKFIVGMVASFSELKDYKTYIESANLVLEKNSDVTFLCIGSGDDSNYRKLVKKEFKEFVKFIGHQNDVESIMNSCDIGILSTYTEGISNSVMEFMALGKPVIVNGGGGTEELIEDGKSGFIVQSKNPEALAEKINMLLSKGELISQIGNNAKDRIKSDFSLEAMTSEYLAAYSDLLAAHKN